MCRKAFFKILVGRVCEDLRCGSGGQGPVVNGGKAFALPEVDLAVVYDNPDAVTALHVLGKPQLINATTLKFLTYVIDADGAIETLNHPTKPKGAVFGVGDAIGIGVESRTCGEITPKLEFDDAPTRDCELRGVRPLQLRRRLRNLPIAEDRRPGQVLQVGRLPNASTGLCRAIWGDDIRRPLAETFSTWGICENLGVGERFGQGEHGGNHDCIHNNRVGNRFSDDRGLFGHILRRGSNNGRGFLSHLGGLGVVPNLMRKATATDGQNHESECHNGDQQDPTPAQTLFRGANSGLQTRGQVSLFASLGLAQDCESRLQLGVVQAIQIRTADVSLELCLGTATDG